MPRKGKRERESASQQKMGETVCRAAEKGRDSLSCKGKCHEITQHLHEGQGQVGEPHVLLLGHGDEFF